MEPETQRRTVHLPRTRGQSALIIALSMLMLIAIVGLAIDGGSVYAQRRNAQNTSDAAALAATRVMLNYYDQMILDYAWDVDLAYDSQIDSALTTYSTQHGIPRSNLEAYYINDNKQQVGTAQVGAQPGGLVPWVEGAKGIVVKSRGETNSFFMGVFGWSKIGASATSSAFMGIAVDSGSGIPVLPVGFFTDTNHIDNLVIGQTYTLISSDITGTIGSGNWGYLDFNGNGSASVDRAWLACGFNPAVTTGAGWTDWANAQGCGNQNANTNQAAGPTEHYMCADTSDPDCMNPASTFVQVPYLKWGDGQDGWWLAGETGTQMSDCHALATMVNGIDGREFLVPMFDHWITGSGSGSRFHLARIGKFYLHGSVQCNGQSQHWNISGMYEEMYTPASTGRHGDLRHTSTRIVFLDN